MVSTDFTRRAIPAEARLSSWHAPDGWPHRRFDWPVRRPRGRLLFQAGRADTVEKYLESFAFFHARGWSVTSFDWRGQGGSGRIGDDPLVNHAVDLAPMVDDLAAFWRGWRAEAAGPVAALGHSMGGLLMLRARLEAAIDPAALVLVAPMLGLRTPFGRWGERVARLIGGLGDPARGVWREGSSPRAQRRRMARLTHDAARYADEQWWYATAPELRLGPPSWAWVDAAFRATRALARDVRLDQVETPVLMLVADHDRLVDPRVAARVASRLPRAELLRFGADAAHEILRERDAVRDRALSAIDAFLHREVPRG